MLFGKGGSNINFKFYDNTNNKSNAQNKKANGTRTVEFVSPKVKNENNSLIIH